MDRNLLLDTLRHKANLKTPWVPFVGVHAGFLVGQNATEMLTQRESILKGMEEAIKLFDPDGFPVFFDLQVEAEILGCGLQWANEAPPSVVTHPLESTVDIPNRLPTAEDGRLPLILDVMRVMKAQYGDKTALYGLICGPFTLASHLRGNTIFMDMFDDEDYVTELIDYCTRVGETMLTLYAQAGMDVLAIVDPLVSQISPDHFEQFLSEPFSRLFKHIASLGCLSSFFVCGNATRNIEVMCKTAPDNISVDENVDMSAAKAITDRYNIALGGNIPLTTTMLFGKPQDNMQFVLGLLDKLTPGNLIISPGCDMPYATPAANTIAAVQAVREPESCREMLKGYESGPDDVTVVLPDYEHLTKPLVEVCTLDSDTCAACTYMMGAANAVKDVFGDAIDVVEYKYTVRENITRFKQMGVQNLPSVYLNGKLLYSSIIPSRSDFEAAIRKVQ